MEAPGQQTKEGVGDLTWRAGDGQQEEMQEV
jgi:hypothetical protein